MNKNTEEVFEIIRNKKVGIFFDDANIFYAANQNGWKIDLLKFKNLFINNCNLIFINYYIGIPNMEDPSYIKSFYFINKIKDIVIIKQKLIKYIHSKEKIIKKANCDIEICIDVVRSMKNIEVVIIVSGDSDFCELRKYVLELNKKIIFICYQSNLSFELKQGKYITLEEIKKFLEKNNS